MATQKQLKPELIAIYRLEFYKKQKKWKLSADARKEKELRASYPNVAKISKVLNETYSIETKAEDEASVLNDAFLKDESDKDLPETNSTHTTLHTQWLEPINACPECQHSEMKAQNPWADYVADGWIRNLYADKCSGDATEFSGFDGRVEGMVWTNSRIGQPPWTGDVPASTNVLAEDCPEQLDWVADGMLCEQLDRPEQLTPWPDDQMWVPHIWGQQDWTAQSLESVEEFLMGAHRAPHSSEVDLCAPEGDVSGEAAARMSAGALSGAVRRHTSSLRTLLREAAQRKYRSTLSLDVCSPGHSGLAPRDFFGAQYSYDAFPTREVPSSPLSPASHFGDVLNPLPSMSHFDDGYHPLPLPNQYKQSFTPSSPTSQFKHDFIPLPPTNQFTDPYTPWQCANEFSDTFTPVSPANLYRDGFLAGSHRNTVPPGAAGRGRGRLRLDA